MINLLNKYTGLSRLILFFWKKSISQGREHGYEQRTERGPFLRSEITDSNNMLPIFLFELPVV